MGVLLFALRATASTLLGVAFFVALLLGVLFDMVHKDLLNDEFYVRQLAANDIYQRIHTDILPAVNVTPLYYGGLQVSQEEAQQLSREVFPPEFVRAETEGVIRNFLPWLKGQTDDLRVVIDLTPVRDDARWVAVRFAKAKLDTIPPCPTGEVIDWTRASQGALPHCIPEGADGEAARQRYMAALTAAIDQAVLKAPPLIDLVAVGAMETGLSRDDFLDRIQRVRTVVAVGNALGGAFTIGALVTLALLLGVVHLPRLRGSAMWVGATVALSGGVILATTLVARAILPPRVEAFILSRPELYPKAVQLVTDVSRSAFYEMAADIARPAAIAFLVGVLLLGVSFLLPRRVGVPSAERLRLRALRRYLRGPRRQPRE
ncbi:MAG: hypothetical protein Q8O40_07640 [Chloroflexota bacterium]|nr:hypothetical protein [Chloroflexota bacterium]